MGKKIRWIVMAVALLVFLGSGGALLAIHGRYRASRQGYDDAAAQYTQKAEQSRSVSERSDPASEADSTAAAGERPPITVDFTRLQADNPEVVGWIYCAGTNIDYPVVQGSDNDFYLHHNYAGAEERNGAIFVDAQCTPGFADSNSVIYGHSMKDGSMFSKLDLWKDQAYYEAHPVMWLLTPEADYRVTLFSGYTTSAYSDTYRIFSGSGESFTEYLSACQAQSDFAADVTLDLNGKYVLLSTCAYDFDDARYVLHGMLEKLTE